MHVCGRRAKDADSAEHAEWPRAPIVRTAAPSGELQLSITNYGRGHYNGGPRQRCVAKVVYFAK